MELGRAAEAAKEADDTDKASALSDLAKQSSLLSTTITKNDVVDFYFYYVTRGVYAELGAGAYVTGYQNEFLQTAIAACQQLGAALGLTCPEETEVTLDQAKLALLRHADNTFSSVSTAGTPLPLWSEGDGTGTMFGGSEPVGGSGIDMSQQIPSVAVYLNITNYGNTDGSWTPLYEGGAAGFADPTSDTWKAMVDTNPMYA